MTSGSQCILECSAGYSSSSKDSPVGRLQCDNKVWSVVADPLCMPDPCTLPVTPEGAVTPCAAGDLIPSGDSFTYGVVSGFTLQSGTLLRECEEGSFTTPPPVLVQETQDTATKSAENQVASTSLAAAAPDNGDACAAHTDCSSCTADLDGGCGWCASSGACSSGEWDGDSAGACSSDAWRWSVSSCSPALPAAQAVCAAATSCETCGALRGCGWCETSQRCSLGTWSGASYAAEPAGCVDPDWIWSAGSCGSATPLDTASVLTRQYGGLSLSPALKADSAGNLFKSGMDPVSAWLKEDVAGNFFKRRPSFVAAGDGSDVPNSISRRTMGDDAADVVDVLPSAAVSPYDPEPWNDALPHGHVEAAMADMDEVEVAFMGGVVRAMVAGNTCNGGGATAAASSSTGTVPEDDGSVLVPAAATATAMPAVVALVVLTLAVIVTVRQQH